MWIADILVALMGLYGVFGIAVGIWSIRHRHERPDGRPNDPNDND